MCRRCQPRHRLLFSPSSDQLPCEEAHARFLELCDPVHRHTNHRTYKWQLQLSLQTPTGMWETLSEINQEPLLWVQLKLLTLRFISKSNSCYFKPLSFGIVCYAEDERSEKIVFHPQAPKATVKISKCVFYFGEVFFFFPISWKSLGSTT